MQFLWKYIDDLVGKGLEFNVIAELLLYASASLVPLALPLAILLSSIMTFGNMAEHYELMAIKSSGINLFRIMLPMIVLVSIIGIGAFFFSNNVMPYTNLKMGSLLYDVRKQKPEVSIQEGVFNDLMEGYVIKVGSKSKSSSMMYDIMIYDHSEKQGNRKVTISDSATMEVTSDSKYMILNMYSGYSYDEIKEKKRRSEREYPHQITSFKRQRILIDMSGLGFERTDERLFKNHYQMLNLDQLNYTIDSLGKKFEVREKKFTKTLVVGNYFKRLSLTGADSNWFSSDSIMAEHLSIDSLFASLSQRKQRTVFENAKNYVRSSQSLISTTQTELSNKFKWIKRHEIEWHRKFVLSFSCLLLFFIGAPLGAIIRKGGLGMPVVVSVFFFVVYYVISMSGEKSAKIGEWDAWIGMWISAIVLFPLGIFLTYKAATDSVILNIDTYLKPLKKLFVLRKKVKKVILNRKESNPFGDLENDESNKEQNQEDTTV